MRQDVAEKWIAALESGEFTQGTGRLARQPEGKPAQHCCLGVLCELAIRDGVPVTRTGDNEAWSFTYDGEEAILPQSVVEWADLRTERGAYLGKDEDGYTIERALTADNDNGHTFDEIARTIREHVSEL